MSILAAKSNIFSPKRAKSQASRSNMSTTSEASTQKEVEDYIRKLEVQKKNLQNIEETYNMVFKELQDRLERYEKCKVPLAEAKIKFKNRIKILENSYELHLAKYNENNTHNQNTRSQIDVVRGEVLIYQKVVVGLLEKIEKNAEIYQKTSFVIEKKLDQTKTTKDKIFQLKCQNEDDKKNFNESIDKLQKELQAERIMSDTKNKGMIKKAAEGGTNSNTVERKSLMKKRIQKLIINSKEKVKLMEEYHKIMKSLDEAFHRLQEVSGMNDPDEIMTSFIKSEEQHAAVYIILDDLEKQFAIKKNEFEEVTKELDDLTEQHKKLQEKYIKEKQIADGIALNDTSVIIDEKNREILENRYKLASLHTVIVDFLHLAEEFGKKFDLPRDSDGITFNINDKNLHQFLAVLEEFINSVILYESRKKGESSIFSSTLLFESQNKGNSTFSAQFDRFANEQDFDIQSIKNDGKFYHHDEFMDMIKNSSPKKKQAMKESKVLFTGDATPSKAQSNDYKNNKSQKQSIQFAI